MKNKKNIDDILVKKNEEETNRDEMRDKKKLFFLKGLLNLRRHLFLKKTIEYISKSFIIIMTILVSMFLVKNISFFLKKYTSLEAGEAPLFNTYNNEEVSNKEKIRMFTYKLRIKKKDVLNNPLWNEFFLKRVPNDNLRKEDEDYYYVYFGFREKIVKDTLDNLIDEKVLLDGEVLAPDYSISKFQKRWTELNDK